MSDPELFNFQESEEDLLSLDAKRFREAVVFNTDWTTETVLSQLKRGNIALNPSFQRRDAWRQDRKSRFIESLILGMPVPPLVLAERKQDRGSYIVIDGKQRLLALRQFAAVPGDDAFKPLRLKKLTIRPDLSNLTLEDLRAAPRYLDDLRTFENHTIRTVVVKNWPSEDFLYLLFLRLNTGSVPLSPQELRQALHPGEFVSFADDFSISSHEVKHAMGLKRADFRMRDVELVVRYYAFRNFIANYRGDLKYFLDRTCMQLNTAWAARRDTIIRQSGDLEAAISTTFDVFGRSAFRRFGERTYEKRFNRAVFDVMIWYFSLPGLAGMASEKREEVRIAFERLCTHNLEFSRSLQTTTKSTDATFYRLATWGQRLGDVVGEPLDFRGLIPVVSGLRDVW